MSGADTTEADHDEERPAEQSVAGAQTSSRPNYVIRHWRGKLSLPISYWVNGFLLNVVFVTPGLALFVTLNEERRPFTLLLLVLTLWIVTVAFTIWQLVGTWRSAQVHSACGGSRFWSAAAQVSVGIAGCVVLYQVSVVAPAQIAELAKIALGDKAMGAFEIGVPESGQVVEMRGGFIHGLHEALQAELDRNPSAIVVDLNSAGGRLGEARKVAALIRSRGLATYTSEGCYSACTIAFAAGRARGMAAHAEMGFHSPAFPGLTELQAQEEMSADRWQMEKAGIDRAFLEKAWRVPADDMWVPSADELLTARFITQPPGMLEVSDPYASTELVERLLATDPDLRALIDSDRERFDTIRNAAWRELRDGASQDEVIRDARKSLTKSHLSHIGGQ